MPAMRIAMVLTGLDGGGAQRRFLTLAGGFLERGHEVELLVGRASGAFEDEVPAGVRIHELAGRACRIAGIASRKSLRMLAGLPRLAGFLRANRPDVVVAASTPGNLAALVARAAAHSRTAVVATLNVPLSSSTKAGRRPLSARMVRHWYPQADAIVANSPSLVDDALCFADLDPSVFATIANPVATRSIASRAEEAPGHPWALDPHVPLVVSVGKLKRQKDHATLLRAFRLLRDSRRARLLVLGEGEERERLEVAVRELRLEDDVAMPGFSANPFAILARASVFVTASRWEGFSNAVAEAFACGCPVVATEGAGGIAGLLGDGRHGTLVPVGDADALAAALLESLRRPPDRVALRRRAAEFPVAAAVDAYLDVLGRAVARREASR